MGLIFQLLMLTMIANISNGVARSCTEVAGGTTTAWLPTWTACITQRWRKTRMELAGTFGRTIL